MTANAKAILDDLVARISADTVIPYVRDSLFIDGADIPCLRWSPLNRFMVHLSHSSDARGIRQWSEVGRRIREGASAIYILVPIMMKLSHAQKDGERDDSTTETAETKQKLVGFKAMPVFRLEDTEGKELEYTRKMRAFDPETLPLISVASSLGVEVRAKATADFCGAYSHRKKVILLASDNPQVFLHELAHAVDNAIPGKREESAYNEVVAELSACFLGSLYGVPVDIGSTKAYIESYTGRGHVAFKVVEAMERVKAIYKYIEGTRPTDKPKIRRRLRVQAKRSAQGSLQQEFPA